MIELSSEARMAYEVMLSNLEQTNIEEELLTSPVAEKIDPSSGDTQPEQPEYSKCDKLAEVHKLYPGIFLNLCCFYIS